MYVGSMDIEKAFDHVPRSLLLKKLITLGVGKCMLHALKQVYSFSVCVLKFQSELSGTVVMKRGVRQGAASSVLLFNAYIDGLFAHLESKCKVEEILLTIHALIHADDTIILSTERSTFIKKCNETISFFNAHKLNLNLAKSCYLVINPLNADDRRNLILDSGVLKYRKKIEYLGVIISDTASIKEDVKSFIHVKRPNISIKFSNFCKMNRNAPLDVKLNVLDTCVASALTYGSETWGTFSKEADTANRCGLKTALGVRHSTNTEIVHIETGKFPLHCKIITAQLKFWVYINEYMEKFPDSAVNKVVNLGLNCKVSYLQYYQKLLLNHRTANICVEQLQNKCMDAWKQKITKASGDLDSKLGTYHRINPLLKPFVPAADVMTENERITTSRFRTGSHSLAIEIGRFSNTKRENRLCRCGSDVQTIWHLFNDCVHTRAIVHGKQYENLREVFDDQDVHKLLFRISKELKIQI